MDSMKSPLIPRTLLRLLLPHETRDAVLGDLEEAFGAAPDARAWYWKQALRSSGPAIRMRWNTPGVLRIGAATIASYVVLAACVVGLEAAISPFVSSPTVPYMLLSLLVGSIGAVCSGAVIAALVPMAPMRAVKIYTGFLCLMAVVSFLTMYGQTPLWYAVALLVAGPYCGYLGGLLTCQARFSGPAGRVR